MNAATFAPIDHSAQHSEAVGATYNHGWYKLAFVRDLIQDLTPATIGKKRFVIARTENGIRVIDANCPHRGAHLAGGKLDRNAVICPFHCYRIGIGRESVGDFQVREYETFVISGMIFMRLSDQHDNGFAEFMTRLEEENTLHPGFTMEIRTAPELIVENGFDYQHFRPVHKIEAARFFPECDEHGSLMVRSTFHAQVRDDKQVIPLQLNAFSPYLSVAQLGGRRPLVFITSVNPIGENHTLLRFSLGLPRSIYGEKPPYEMVNGMLAGNKVGIYDDVVIWENISLTSPRNYTSQDAAILAFQNFCQQFV